jgi:hypothetical protein
MRNAMLVAHWTKRRWQRMLGINLESAPVPATGNTGGNLRVLVDRRERGLQTIVLRVVRAIRIIRVASVLPGVDRLLDHAEAAAARFLPAQESAPTEVAGTRRDPLGVETSLLIKGNEIWGVGGAEHVTAVAAVVPTQEEAEGGAAGGRVAAR